MMHNCEDLDVEMEDVAGQDNDGDDNNPDHIDDKEEEEEASNHVLAAAGLNIPTLSLQHRNLLDQIENFDELIDPILEDAPHFVDGHGDVSSLDTITFTTSTVTVPSGRPRRVDDTDVLASFCSIWACAISVFVSTSRPWNWSRWPMPTSNPRRTTDASRIYFS